MRSIIELAEATSPVSMAKLLSGSSRAASKASLIAKLYKYLRDGELEEQVIVTRLYGKEVSPSDSRYRSLKSRLKQIMLGSLLNDEVMGGSYATYDKAYITGTRQLNLARILVIRRAYKTAGDVATTAFRNVRGYEILALNEGLSDILCSLYLGILNNPKLFKKYYVIHEYYAEALYDFSKISGQYRLMRSKVYAHKDSPAKIGELSLSFAAKSQLIMNKYLKVPPLQAMVRTTECMGLKLSGRYQEAITAAQQAEKTLLACKGVSSLIISGVALMQVECALHLRDFELGKEQIDNTRRLIPAGTINSIKLSEYAVLLGLYTHNFDYAYRQIINLDRSTLKKLPNDRVAEFWFILEAYIRLLILAGRIEVAADDGRVKEFKMGKFMNDVTSYSANKHGMNIQILILQAMFFIINGEIDTFQDRTGALDRYCNRYLKENEKLRHNCFFRLLTEVVKSKFNLRANRRKIEKIYDRMTSLEAMEISYKTNSEIVPYEVLWDILTESVERHVASGILVIGKDPQPLLG